MMKRSTPIFALFASLFVISVISAQTAPGRIKATVSDPAGANIPNAFVQIRSKSNKKFTAGGFTNGDGEFLSDSLPAGEYEVSADVMGMKYLNENVSVRDEGTVFVDVKVNYGANCPLGLKGTDIKLSDADAREIISSILSITDGPSDKTRKKKKFLSRENIQAEWVKDLGYIVLNKSELKERADGHGEFRYLQFSNWKIGENCVVVMLSQDWATGRNSRVVHMDVSGTYFLYQKVDGKWTGTVVGAWIS
jgi:hypothetical protein